jgi:hypothetical protein
VKKIIFSFFFYKIREQKGETGPAQGAVGNSRRDRWWGKKVGG